MTVVLQGQSLCRVSDCVMFPGCRPIMSLDIIILSIHHNLVCIRRLSILRHVTIPLQLIIIIIMCYRCMESFKQAFAEADLTVIKEENQENWPQNMFQITMYTNLYVKYLVLCFLL